jgi:hypothetical protein
MDDCLLLLQLGVAMSHKGPPLLQEDSGRNSNEDGQDGHNGQIEKSHELHNCSGGRGHHCCRKTKVTVAKTTAKMANKAKERRSRLR